MAFLDRLLDHAGHWLGRALEKQSSGYEPFTPSDPVTLRRILRPADVLLIEGNQKLSSAIKYLTQSTWSHAAFHIGGALGERTESGELKSLIEVNLGEGCVATPLSKYQTYNTRICRPVGLSAEDREKVVAFMMAHLGVKYDNRNIIDLARYLLPAPPVPVRWRRRMLALGSGEPTRAVCSTLIAQAFQSVRYPILPHIERVDDHEHVASQYARKEILHVRHHSLFAPRDFDISPYFKIIKPTIEKGFDYKALTWGKDSEGENSPDPDRPGQDRHAALAARQENLSGPAGR